MSSPQESYKWSAQQHTSIRPRCVKLIMKKIGEDWDIETFYFQFKSVTKGAKCGVQIN